MSASSGSCARLAGPNQLWVTDLTMIPTGEGPPWLSAIRDAFSRRVVAWETSARADAASDGRAHEPQARLRTPSAPEATGLPPTAPGRLSWNTCPSPSRRHGSSGGRLTIRATKPGPLQ
ncbi:DDE-type integrase/transposase/recombinase [Streptomyces eurythermus]